MFKGLFRPRSKSAPPLSSDSTSTSESKQTQNIPEEVVLFSDIPKLKRSQSFVAPVNTKAIEAAANSFDDPDISFDPFSSPSLKRSKSLSFKNNKRPSFPRLGRKRSVSFNPEDEDDGKHLQQKPEESTQPVSSYYESDICTSASISSKTEECVSNEPGAVTEDHQKSEEKTDIDTERPGDIPTYEQNQEDVPSEYSELFCNDSNEIEFTFGNQVETTFNTSIDRTQVLPDAAPELYSIPQNRASTPNLILEEPRASLEEISEEHEQFGKLSAYMNIRGTSRNEILRRVLQELERRDEQILNLNQGLNSKEIEIESQQEQFKQISQKYYLDYDTVTTELKGIQEEKEKLLQPSNDFRREAQIANEKLAKVADYNAIKEEKSQMCELLANYGWNPDSGNLNSVSGIIAENESLKQETQHLLTKLGETAQELEEQSASRQDVMTSLKDGLNFTIEQKQNLEYELENTRFEMGAKIHEMQQAMEIMGAKNASYGCEILQRDETIKDLEADKKSLQEDCRNYQGKLEKMEVQQKHHEKALREAKERAQKNAQEVEKKAEQIQELQEKHRMECLEKEDFSRLVESLNQSLGQELAVALGESNHLSKEIKRLEGVNESSSQLVKAYSSKVVNMRNEVAPLIEIKDSHRMLYGAYLSLIAAVRVALEPVLEGESLSYARELQQLCEGKHRYTDEDALFFFRISKFYNKAFRHLVHQFQTNEKMLEEEIQNRDRNYSRILENLTRMLENRVSNVDHAEKNSS